MIPCYMWKHVKTHITHHTSHITCENCNFEYKEDKAINANAQFNMKTIESKHVIHYSKWYLQTLPLLYLPTSKRNYCFFFCIPAFLVQSFSVSTFLRTVDCFHDCKLLSVWSYKFLINGPDKKPKENRSKQNNIRFTVTGSNCHCHCRLNRNLSEK